jgi:hypothetical protein
MQIPVTCDKYAVASRSCSPKRHLFHLTPGIQASTDARIQTGGGKQASITARKPKLDSRKDFFHTSFFLADSFAIWSIDST